MSDEQMNSYRLTSMEEPGDERMAQIMREVAEDARESTRRAAERVAAGIEAATLEARARVEETLSRLRNGGKWTRFSMRGGWRWPAIETGNNRGKTGTCLYGVNRYLCSR